MELNNEFHVELSVNDAWQVLTDVERIAPCMPGAELQEIEGEEYRGVVKVKVGPITAQYKGKATFVERDDLAHRAVLRAEGRDTRGAGNASATVTATLAPDGDRTKVTVVTDLTVTGKVAQFGRGVMADVSAKLLDQFLSCLQTKVLAAPAPNAPAAAAAAPATPAPAKAAAPASAAGLSSETVAAPPQTTASTNDTVGPASGAGEVRRIQSAPAQPIDLLQHGGAPVIKRAAPAVALLFLAVWLLRRRRKG